MSDFDDLDSLLGPLREPATPAELASERAMVDLMATSHRHAKGNIMFSSRRARVATLIAAGVIGFGGVAAAGGGLGLTGPDSTPDVDPAPQEIEEIEIEEIEVEEVEVEVEEITTTTAAAAVEESDDTFTDEVAKATLAAVAQDVADDVEDDVADDDPYPETDFDENDCLEGNHGKTVSAVARGDELDQFDDDVEVRDAAQSQCGKFDDVEDDDVDQVEDDVDAEDEDEDADDADEGADADEDADDADEDADADHEDRESTSRQEAPAGRESNGGNGGQGNGNGRNGKSGDDD